ncbi:MAG: Gldg family protein [Gammaproteobacteria bacterium]|nr:Gldg family protein [Gammaproteobacteria bacterium]
MNSAGRRRIGYSTLGLLVLVFVAAVMASNTLLRGMRLDLTENNLYTLAPGTVSLLQNLEEPVNLYLFFSDRATQDVPFLRTYAARVQEMLEELAANSDGQLNVETVDPQPFSEEEDRATQFGIEPISLGTAGENIYFGLAGTNSVGDEAVIAFLQPDKEPFLEYDLARLIYSLANPEKPVIGLLSGTNMSGGFDPATRQPSQPWFITQQARQLFDVRTLPTSLDSIDEDIGVLWVVHPEDLDDQTLYAIDQFVLRGGRALIFVDPLAEVVGAAAGPSGFGAPGGSTLTRLFDAWGVEFSEDQVVADNVYGLSVNMGPGQRPVRHIGLLGLDAEAMDQQDVITSGLETINIGTAGHFTATGDGEATLSPLLTSSPEAALLPAERFQFLSNPGDLLNDFTPTGERYVLAARLEGPVETAFPDGPPQQDSADDDAGATAADEQDAAAGGEAADAGGDDGSGDPGDGPAGGPEGGQESDGAPAHLTSADSANVVLVGDVDVLSDRMWVQVQSFLGQQLATAFASNGDFVTNALDNLSGSAELIGLRSRATYSRPFTTVEALQREADAQFRATEQRLQAELAETERRLAELQSARDDTTSLLMSPEQQQELERFLDQQVRIRQELRAVRRNLDQSIEQLGTRLKIVNIVAVPLALTIIALLVVFIRRRRKVQR